MYSLSLLVSKSNNDALYYQQAMRADDANDFREVMGKDTNSFKRNDTFKLTPLQNKVKHKSLTPFVWSLRENAI